MTSRATFFHGISITRVATVLLFSLVGVLLPKALEAQCVTCGFDFAEDTFECADAHVGADWCASGLSYDFETKEWLSWCIGGGFCEWIVHLDFAEDGTAYAQSASTPRGADDRLVGSEVAIESPKSCDGVLLGTRMTKMQYVQSNTPITLEI